MYRCKVESKVNGVDVADGATVKWRIKRSAGKFRGGGALRVSGSRMKPEYYINGKATLSRVFDPSETLGRGAVPSIKMLRD